MLPYGCLLAGANPTAAAGANPTRSRGDSHGSPFQRQIPRDSRGQSHALQGRFPQSRHSRGKSHIAEKRNRRSDGVSDFRHRGICLCSLSWPRQRQIPRLPGANPTRSRGDSHGSLFQRRIPRGSSRRRGESHALQGRFPRLAGSRGQSHAGRTAPEANPTRSRGISHGGRLQRQIPRTPEAIPTHSRGQSHKAGTLEANPTWPKRETAGQMGCQICGTVGFVSDVVHP